MRVSPKTYYGCSGRFRDNRGKKKTAVVAQIRNPIPLRKFSECSCTRMIQIIDNIFVDHGDAFGIFCDGSGEHKDYWKY